MVLFYTILTRQECRDVQRKTEEYCEAGEQDAFYFDFFKMMLRLSSSSSNNVVIFL